MEPTDNRLYEYLDETGYLRKILYINNLLLEKLSVIPELFSIEDFLEIVSLSLYPRKNDEMYRNLIKTIPKLPFDKVDSILANNQSQLFYKKISRRYSSTAGIFFLTSIVMVIFVMFSKNVYLLLSTIIVFLVSVIMEIHSFRIDKRALKIPDVEYRGKKVFKVPLRNYIPVLEPLEYFETGQLDDEEAVICPKCHGEGELKYTRRELDVSSLNLPENVPLWDQYKNVTYTFTCNLCNGLGKFNKINVIDKYNSEAKEINRKMEIIFGKFPSIKKWSDNLNSNLQLWNSKLKS